MYAKVEVKAVVSDELYKTLRTIQAQSNHISVYIDKCGTVIFTCYLNNSDRSNYNPQSHPLDAFEETEDFTKHKAYEDLEF